MDTAYHNQPTSSSAFAIETRQLPRRFNSFTAVDQIDLSVPYGSIFGLLGPNGAGQKSRITEALDYMELSEHADQLVKNTPVT